MVLILGEWSSTNTLGVLPNTSVFEVYDSELRWSLDQPCLCSKMRTIFWSSTFKIGMKGKNLQHNIAQHFLQFNQVWESSADSSSRINRLYAMYMHARPWSLKRRNMYNVHSYINQSVSWTVHVHVHRVHLHVVYFLHAFTMTHVTCTPCTVHVYRSTRSWTGGQAWRTSRPQLN